MFYEIRKDRMEESDLTEWKHEQNTVAVFTQKEWEQEMDIRATYLLNQSEDNIHFCKLENHPNYLFGTAREADRPDCRSCLSRNS